MSGRRLRDGAIVKGPYARGIPGAALGVAALVAALATVPTHGSFEQHLLTHADSRPAGADPDGLACGHRAPRAAGASSTASPVSGAETDSAAPGVSSNSSRSASA